MFGKSALRSSGFVDLNETSAFPARPLCCLAFTWLGRCDGPENPDRSGSTLVI